MPWRRDYTTCPRLTPEEEARDLSLLSFEERLLAYADLYGCKPDELENLEEFEREMSLIPAKQKASLHKGYTIEQARQFLRLENNDPRAAAERMARYWDVRERMLGEDAFKEDHVKAKTIEDHRRIYGMAQSATVDPEVDTETKQWAKNYISQWNRAHFLDLDDEVDAIRSKDPSAGVALAKAQRSRPDLCATNEHKLLFLQCEDFDIPRAARRMIRYWDLRMVLFGDSEDSYQSPTVDALMDECPLELSLNFLQILPNTDDSGRTIICIWPGKVLEGSYEVEGVLKTMWYIFHAALEEEACRKNGAVLLVILKDFEFPGTNWWKFVSDMLHLVFECIPVNIRLDHDCAPPSPWFFQTFAPIIKWVIGRRMRMRYWVHVGTDEQIVTELGMCGISRAQIPTVLGGSFNFDSSGVAWLEKRKDAGL